MKTTYVRGNSLFLYTIFMLADTIHLFSLSLSLSYLDYTFCCRHRPVLMNKESISVAGSAAVASLRTASSVVWMGTRPPYSFFFFRDELTLGINSQKGETSLCPANKNPGLRSLCTVDLRITFEVFFHIKSDGRAGPAQDEFADFLAYLLEGAWKS